MKDQVEQKVNSGDYSFEEISCPICDAADSRCIGTKDRYGLYYPTKICKSCGLVFTSPRMTQNSYNEFYNVEYRKLYNGKESVTADFFYTQKRRGEKIFNFLKKNSIISEKPLLILEVGCGAGGILDYFKEKGHKVIGIDLGQEYIEYGRKQHGLDLEVGYLSQLNLIQKPDLIIYSHVLEHILDLNKELEAIHQISSRESKIYIEVPGIKEIHINFESNILRYFQNAHTFHFTLETLKNLFGQNGFELIVGNQFVQSVFQRSDKSFRITNDYDNCIKYLNQAESNRRLYWFTPVSIKNMMKLIILRTLEITRTRKIARSLKKAIWS